MKKIIIITTILLFLSISTLFIYWKAEIQEDDYFLENEKFLKINHDYLDKARGCTEISGVHDFFYEWIDEDKLKIIKTTSIMLGGDSLKEVQSSLDNDGELNVFVIKNYVPDYARDDFLSIECSEFIIEDITKGEYTVKFYYLNPKMTETARSHSKEPEVFKITENQSEQSDISINENKNEYLDKYQMIEKAKESLLEKWSNSVAETELEIVNFETPICPYDDSGQPIRFINCWPVGYIDESVKEKINETEKLEDETLYYISFEVNNNKNGDGCDTVGADVLITNKGRIINIKDVILCVDFFED